MDVCEYHHLIIFVLWGHMWMPLWFFWHFGWFPLVTAWLLWKIQSYLMAQGRINCHHCSEKCQKCKSLLCQNVPKKVVNIYWHKTYWWMLSDFLFQHVNRKCRQKNNFPTLLFFPSQTWSEKDVPFVVIIQ